MLGTGFATLLRVMNASSFRIFLNSRDITNEDWLSILKNDCKENGKKFVGFSKKNKLIFDRWCAIHYIKQDSVIKIYCSPSLRCMIFIMKK